MGMSTHIKAITPPDETWEQIKAIYDAYKNANIEPPEKIKEFFNFVPPDDKGVVIDLFNHPAITSFEMDNIQGYDIQLDKLPSQTTILRVYNAW